MLESKYLHLMHTFVDVCKEGDEEKRKAMLYNLDISDIHEGGYFLPECYGFQPHLAVLPYPFHHCSGYQPFTVI